MISQYDLPDEEKYGVKNLFHVRTAAELQASVCRASHHATCIM
jgi:hypothetical protein